MPVVQAGRPNEKNLERYDHSEAEGKDIFIKKNLEPEDPAEGITISAAGRGKLTRLFAGGLKNY